ncbi:MAG: uroporphyrinogen-III C-methyltransferase [Burkholderia sp.]
MGKVYLIGAGPGAADLITVRGARLLGLAEVVLHDALIEPAMLEHAPNARRIAVGKRCGQRSTAQQFINKQIIDTAREHAVVVRLKGGDPMLFGRADEEMRALEAADIDYEVVPGITAALAGAAALKRSLTLRGVSRSVAFATQSRAPGSDEIREQVQADSLVFYMGRDSAPGIAQQLIDAGRAGDTQVAIVEACSTPRERSLALTLARMAAGEAQAWLDALQPSLLMIGAALAERADTAAEPGSDEDAGQPARKSEVRNAA